MIKPTPWIERSFHFDLPVGLFPIIFSRLEGTLFRLSHLLSTADDESCSSAKTGWSVKQHVGHLYDLEELWWQRLNDFQSGKAILTAADMTNKKTHEALHNENTLERLMLQFTIERQRMLEAIYYFDEPTLSITSVHPRLNKPMRIIDALYFIAEHDDHHITAISNGLRIPTD